MNYHIKGMKQFRGHEGEPLQQGWLYLDGKKLAQWSDDTHGGPLHLRFIDPGDQPAFETFALEWYRTSGALAEMVAYFAEVNKGKSKPVEMPPTTAYDAIGSWFSFHADKLVNEKRFDKASIRGTLYRLKGDSQNEWRIHSQPYSESIADGLRKHFGERFEALYVPTKFRKGDAS
ncbi:hypothetical protein [Caballeronia sp. ATUFL_M1_KS5A]|uniref:hypothetical protein n=1 Tax=Caballeronia sp. ATUFL_M1_KS5A TaxID=2921778 RepID=UPI002028031A|nr:hypothetical protein [Caballeronia sp. ATUFL_M1_KS5A]